MTNARRMLEVEFLQLCLQHGPGWVESVIRPLHLPGSFVTPRDIPLRALVAIVRMFGRVPHPANGVTTA